MKDQISSKALRKYFHNARITFPIILLTLSVVTFAAGRDLQPVGMALFMIGLLWFIIALSKKIGRPSDEMVDQLIREELARIIEKSYDKVGLDKSQIIGEPLVITAPILWQTSGIPKKDLLYMKGKDRLVRFNVYKCTVIHLAEHLLAVYTCDINFLRQVRLNERTEEYHYRDIVAVSTQETSSSYTLPNGQRFVHAQAFRLSAVNGESVEVVISSPLLQKITDGSLPPTGAEKAVQVIRTMLREKK